MSTVATSRVAEASAPRAGLAPTRMRDVATGLAPAALIAFFGFRAGGFFPETVAIGTLAVLAALAVTLAVRGSLAGLRLPFVLAACALGLFAVWTMASSAWSHAPARAVVEYDRALLYAAGFVLFGMLGRTSGSLRWLVRGIVLATVAVCVCSLITRLTPDVWAVTTPQRVRRLAYPLTYWNALGLMAAMGFVLSAALTCDDRETRTGRVLAAAALPILAATLLLTLSRGAILVTVVGLAALAVVGRPRALLGGLVAAAPAVLLTLHVVYRATLVTTGDAADAVAVAQGHRVGVVVLACVLAAAVDRAALLALDRRAARLALPAALKRPAVVWAAALAAVIAACAAAVALSLPARVGDKYARFVDGGSPATTGDLRARLTSAANNGRIVQWNVAVEGYRAHPLRGEGAGTYALQWERLRPQPYEIVDAHGLYAEVLGELGIVGLSLVVAAIALVLGGFAALARGPDRVVGGALFAAGLMWALHAGVDWDWEMPVLTFWLFAAGGLALGGVRVDTPRERVTSAASRGFRVAAGAGVLALALVPLSLFRSERALRTGAQAFTRGDCATAVDRARQSSRALGILPEPYALLGYCDVRLGRPASGVRAMQRAVRADHGSWELHYGLGIARAANGQDPRPQLRIAQRLNPREQLATSTLALMRAGDASTWHELAQRAPLPTR